MRSGEESSPSQALKLTLAVSLQSLSLGLLVFGQH
jgi:hypothetical protein